MSELSDLLSFVIPAAVGSALSPTLFIATTGLLSQADQPRKRALSFLVGATASLVVWVLIVYSAVGALLKRMATDAEATWQAHLGLINGVLGAALLLLAVYLELRPDPVAKPADPDQNKTPLWKIAGLGAVLQGRDASSIILFIAALQEIARSAVNNGTKLAVLAGLITITTLPIWLPLVAHVSVPSSFVRKSQPVTDWMRRNRRPIGVAVCVLFGSYLVTRAFFAFLR